MRKLPAERLELIDALVAEAEIGGVTAGLLEKDEHLTAALKAIGLVEDENFRRSLNNNRYTHSQWSYQRAYEGIAALRP